jgi:hypothetical protein
MIENILTMVVLLVLGGVIAVAVMFAVLYFGLDDK